ncbi:hypothetical protein CGZ80_10620 [Rhodopirellula sp. MGV]|nr:hypothetical protein CGZ80_10620 [Rhodopirellula sp. MGV]
MASCIGRSNSMLEHTRQQVASFHRRQSTATACVDKQATMIEPSAKGEWTNDGPEIVCQDSGVTWNR